MKEGRKEERKKGREGGRKEQLRLGRGSSSDLLGRRGGTLTEAILEPTGQALREGGREGGRVGECLVMEACS